MSESKIRYVDNLLEVKPEEIYHIYAKDTKIQEIIKIKYPLCKECPILVVYETGSTGYYTLNGQSTSGRMFAFKPRKIRKYKTLKMLLNEADHYKITDGHIDLYFRNNTIWCVSLQFLADAEAGIQIPGMYEDKLYWYETEEEN